MLNVNLNGWVPNRPDHRDLMLEAAPAEAPSRPTVVDLRPACPPVYDQSTLGSCTAELVAFLFHYRLSLEAAALVETPSVLWLYYVTRLLQGTVDRDSGATIRNALKAAMRNGICHEKYWPYVVSKFKARPTAMAYKDAAKHKPTAAMFYAVPQDGETIKNLLAKKIPLGGGFSVPRSFMSDEVRRTGRYGGPDKNERVIGGHAVGIVGYDDTDGTYWLRNSWGRDFGADGYAKIPQWWVHDRKWWSDHSTVVDAPDNY